MQNNTKKNGHNICDTQVLNPKPSYNSISDVFAQINKQLDQKINVKNQTPVYKTRQNFKQH